VNQSTKYILGQLAPFAECDQATWVIVEKQVEEHGWRDASATAREQIKIAKARWQKNHLFKQRAES
jgi:hypothetical protein